MTNPQHTDQPEGEFNLVVLLDEILPDGWDHNAGIYGMDYTLTCPCGDEIEQDGTCPQGCESPIMGFI